MNCQRNCTLFECLKYDLTFDKKVKLKMKTVFIYNVFVSAASLPLLKKQQNIQQIKWIVLTPPLNYQRQ